VIDGRPDRRIHNSFPREGGAVNLRHLRYFINVVDAGTVIHVAQPALSQQIAELGPNSGSAC
jgi:hypothetical protein